MYVYVDAVHGQITSRMRLVMVDLRDADAHRRTQVWDLCKQICDLYIYYTISILYIGTCGGRRKCPSIARGDHVAIFVRVQVSWSVSVCAMIFMI